MFAYPSGKKYREVGVAVPSRYRAFTKNKAKERPALILKEQLQIKRDLLLFSFSAKDEQQAGVAPEEG